MVPIVQTIQWVNVLDSCDEFVFVCNAVAVSCNAVVVSLCVSYVMRMYCFVCVC